MNRLFKIITFLLVVMLPVVSFSQAGEPRNKAFEKAEKKKEKQEQNEDKFIAKHHKRIQDKETRKRMKKSKKKSKRHQSGKHEDPFYKRWFRKK